MKTILSMIILSVVVVCILYCAFAFYWLSFNPVNWNEEARGFFGIMFIIGIAFSCLITLAIKDLKL